MVQIFTDHYHLKHHKIRKRSLKEADREDEAGELLNGVPRVRNPISLPHLLFSVPPLHISIFSMYLRQFFARVNIEKAVSKRM